MRKREIIVFGYSIAHGSCDIRGGWVERLRGYLTKRFINGKGANTLVYNLSISGNTTEDLLEQVEDELMRRLHKRELIVIFALGVNDTKVDKRGDNLVSTEKFSHNVLTIINIVKKHISEKNIVFVGLIPIDETKVDPIPWDEEYSYKNASIKKYDSILSSITKKQNIHFIEVFEHFVRDNYKVLLFDGVHPNTKGHEFIYEIVRKSLVERGIV